MSATVPRTVRRVPVTASQSRDHELVTRSIAGERGATQWITMALIAATAVATGITSTVSSNRRVMATRRTGSEASGPPPPDAPKAVWRTWARGVSVDVDAVSAAVRGHLDAWLPDGVVVLTYLAMPGEIDPGPPPGDRTVLVTRTPASGPLSVHPLESDRERHPFGFEQPTADAERWTGPVDVVLLPGLAFGLDGSRLGRGTAYFDRLLADHDVPVRVGVAPAARVVDRVPTEPHDVAVTHLATETGVVAVDDVA